MVYNGNPLKLMIWGYHYFWKHPCVNTRIYTLHTCLKMDLVLEGLSPNIEDVFRFVGIHTYFPVKTKMESENNPF